MSSQSSYQATGHQATYEGYDTRIPTMDSALHQGGVPLLFCMNKNNEIKFHS